MNTQGEKIKLTFTQFSKERGNSIVWMESTVCTIHALCKSTLAGQKLQTGTAEVTVFNPSDLCGKGKTCFSQKRYERVID